MRGTVQRGGMQSSVSNSNYCPLCSQIIWVGYPRSGYYSHMTQKGNILLCDTRNNIKRKKVKSAEWQTIMKMQEDI